MINGQLVFQDGTNIEDRMKQEYEMFKEIR